MRRLHTKPSPSLSEKFMDCNSLCAAAKLQILQEKVIQGSEAAAGTPLGLAVMRYHLAKLTKTV